MEYTTQHTPINFHKVDSKRTAFVNTQILDLFDTLINSPGIFEIVMFYRSQNSLLYISRSETGKIKFQGCEDIIDHHGSNIEWIVKYFLHKILRDHGSNKLLFDYDTLALVGFGLLPLFRKEVNGNLYQGFDNKHQCNVNTFKVCLTDKQVDLSRKILRLIQGREILN